MNRDAIEDVSIPIFIGGIALLIASGLFVAAREWVQNRVLGAVSGGTGAPSTQSSSGASGFDNPNAGAGQGAGGGGGGAF